MWSERKTLSLLLLACLLISSLPTFLFKTSSAYSPYTSTVMVSSGTVFKLTSVYFQAGSSFIFRGLRVNQTHLWLNRSFTDHYYASYVLWVSSPSAVNLTIDTFFNAELSTSQLTLTYPSSTDIVLSLYSPHLLTASATGVVSYSYNELNSTLTMKANSDTSTVITITAYVSEVRENLSPEIIGNAQILNLCPCVNMTFAETVYYDFYIQYYDLDGYSDLNDMKIAFTDGYHWVNITYNLRLDQWNVDEGTSYVNLRDGTVEILNDNVVALTFKIWFERTMFDAMNIDLWAYCDDVTGDSDGWRVVESDFFSLYVLGGYSILTRSGSAGREDGGDVFELYAGSGGSARMDVHWRYFQHLRASMKIQVDTSASLSSYQDKYEWHVGFDYCHDGGWVEGVWANITVAGFICTSIQAYVLYNVEWWYGDELLISEQTVSLAEQPTIGEVTEPIWFRVWVDLWYNLENSSSVIGARVNSKYWGMKDSAPWWSRWWATDWGPVISNVSTSDVFTGLRDADGDIVSARDITLSRVWFEVENEGGTEENRFKDFDILEWTHATGSMQGINTPDPVNPVTPDMPQGGLANSIVSALRWLFNQLIDALTELFSVVWTHIVGGLDWLAGLLGWHGGFSQLLEWIGTFWDWCVTGVTLLSDMLGEIFYGITFASSKLVSLLSMVIRNWVLFMETVLGFLGDSFQTGVNLWDDLDLSTWISFGIFLYPFFLLLLWEEKGIEGVFNHLSFLLNVVMMLINVLLGVAGLFFKVISLILTGIGAIK